MHHKPDPQILIEWIVRRIEDPAGELRTEIGAAIGAAIDVYFDAIEES